MRNRIGVSIFCRMSNALTKPDTISLPPERIDRLKSSRFYLPAAEEAVVLAVVQEGKPAACLSNLEQTAVRHVSDARPLLLSAVTGSGNRRLPRVDRTPGQTKRSPNKR